MPLWLVVVFGWLAACSSGGSSTPTEPIKVKVFGTVIVAASDTNRQTNRAGSECWTAGNTPGFGTPGETPFDDVKKGAQVTLTVGGKTVGIGTLGGGTTRRYGTASNQPPCQFSFVSRVTSGASFYGVHVGSHVAQVAGGKISHPVVTLG